MQCVNCRTDEAPAYTLRAHVEEQADDEADQQAATDGGTESTATVDLRFCSFECLETWT